MAEAETDQRFALEAELGSGGMGVVYRAFDREREAYVALKMLHNVEPGSLLRFKREFRVLQDVDHPNLVRLGELFVEPRRCYFTMELVEGVDFLSFVEATGAGAPPPTTRPGTTSASRRLPTPRPTAPTPTTRPSGIQCDEAKLRRILRQLVSVLVSLHDAGLVHRDIKPHNLLVTDDERLVLLDFGLVSRPDDILESVGHLIGTAAYMAPEQVTGLRPSAATDWYAVGVMVYEALTGRLPFEGTAIELLTRKAQFDPPPPRQLCPEVPADLDDLCAALLRRDPSQRPRAAELLARMGLGPADSPSATRRSALMTHHTAFIGREDELDALARAFTSVAPGQPVTVHVSGPSGMGKSALVRAFTETLRARHEDAVVLQGRCYELESVPFKGFDGVVDALTAYLRQLTADQVAAIAPDDAELVTRLFPVLGRVKRLASRVGTRPRTTDAHELRRQSFDALRQLLSNIAATTPLVLISDDVQWADADTRLLLDALLQPPFAPGLLLILSSRPGTEVVLPGTVRRLELGPLEHGASLRLALHLMADTKLEPAMIERLVSQAGGHPLYIDELVRHAARTGLESLDELDLADAIWQRVTALPEPAARLLSHVCVADEPLAEAVVRDITGLPPSQLDQHVAHLRVNNLVRSTSSGAERRTLEPYHDQIRSTVNARLGDATRRDCHAALAAAFEAAGYSERQPALVLRHLLATGDAARASALAERAAAAAEAAMAFERATTLYGIALDSGDYAGDERRRLLIAYADSAVRAARGALAADAYLEAADGADPTTAMQCHTAAAKELLVHGHLDRGMAALDSLLREAGEALPRSDRAALTSLLWHRTKLRVRGLSFRVRGERQIAEHDLRRQELYQSVATGLAMVDPVRAQVYQTRALLLGLELGEPIRIAEAMAYEGMFHAASGNPARCERVLERLRALDDHFEHSYVAGLVLAVSSAARHFSGDFRGGVDGFIEAERVLRDQPHAAWGEVGKGKVLSLVALRLMGLYAEARPLLAQSLRDAEIRGDAFTTTSLLRSMNSLWLVDDDPEGAEAALERATWTPPEHAVHVQHWFDRRSRLEILLYRGDVPDDLDIDGALGRFRGSLLARVPILWVEFLWLEARLWLGRLDQGGDQARCIAAARRALRPLRAARPPWSRPFAMLVAAALAHRRGKRDQALAILQRTGDVADAAQSYLLAAAARIRFGQLADDATMLGRGVDDTRAQGVQHLDRWLAVLAPGFADLPRLE